VSAWLIEAPGPSILFADRDGVKGGDLRDDAHKACESIRMGNYDTGHEVNRTTA
jgi:hypothetical protein